MTTATNPNSTLQDAIRQRGFKIGVFGIRYGNGLIALAMQDAASLRTIEDDFTTAWDDCEVIEQLLQLPWFPIAHGDTPFEALTNLATKIEPFVAHRDGNWTYACSILERYIDKSVHAHLLNQHEKLQDFNVMATLSEEEIFSGVKVTL